MPDAMPSASASYRPLGAAQETNNTAEFSGAEASGDYSMEDASATARLSETGTTNELQAIIQEANAAHSNTPPPPYEPLAKDRSRTQSTTVPEQVGGQAVNGYATQVSRDSFCRKQH
jgi:hypothetical protein